MVIAIVLSSAVIFWASVGVWSIGGSFWVSLLTAPIIALILTARLIRVPKTRPGPVPVARAKPLPVEVIDRNQSSAPKNQQVTVDLWR